jgi:hypothetical protein
MQVSASPPVKNESTYVAQLRREIAQLRHTLDIRRGEIVLAEQRTAELMDRCATVRSASLATSSKALLVQDLEEELQAARQEEAILRREIRSIQRASEREEAQRQTEQQQQLAFYNALLAQADSVAAFCLKKQQEVKEKPVRAVGTLLSIAADVVDELTAAIDAFQAGEAAAQRQAIRLQNVHSSCIAEIALAAERNEQHRAALEESWLKEEQRLQKELLDVRNRAREAEFHRQRTDSSRLQQHQQNTSGSEFGEAAGGSSAKRHFDVHERQVLATEVLDLEQRISRVLKQRAAERKGSVALGGTSS